MNINIERLRVFARFWIESFLSYEVVLHAKDLFTRTVFIPAAVALVLALLRWANPKDNFPDEAK